MGRELDDVKVELQTELDALAQEDKEVIRPQEPVAEVLQEVAKETDPFQEVLMETFSRYDLIKIYIYCLTDCQTDRLTTCLND